MAQICGASGIKYYLPFLLERLGLDMRAALMASAIEMTIKIFFTILEMFIIDRFGRRNCLAAGCVVMAFSLLVSREQPQSLSSLKTNCCYLKINGAVPLAYGHELSDAASVVCIVFIFVYAMGFSVGFGPAAWVYNTEVRTTDTESDSWLRQRIDLPHSGTSSRTQLCFGGRLYWGRYRQHDLELRYGSLGQQFVLCVHGHKHHLHPGT